jgi:hypothetical protein
MVEPSVSVVAAQNRPYVEWAPIVAGAIAASALSFLLLTFGGAVGLSLTSPWPNSGASATTVAVVIALWAVFVQVSAFTAGGYLAGRMRSRWMESAEESDFRNGAHGFLVWALGVCLGALLLGLGGLSALQTATQSAAVIGAGATAGASNAAAQRIATGPADFATDLLLRPAATPAAQTPANPAAPAAPATDVRPEVNRIFANAIQNRSLQARDRDYLARLVAARTGVDQAEATKRVDEAVAEAQRLEVAAREAADKARKAAILTAFLAAASLLISAVAAAGGASLGGRHRDESKNPYFLGKRFW